TWKLFCSWVAPAGEPWVVSVKLATQLAAARAFIMLMLRGVLRAINGHVLRESANSVEHLIRSFADQHMAGTLERDNMRIRQRFRQVPAGFGRSHHVPLAQDEGCRHRHLCGGGEPIAIIIAGGQIPEQHSW